MDSIKLKIGRNKLKKKTCGIYQYILQKTFFEKAYGRGRVRVGGGGGLSAGIVGGGGGDDFCSTTIVTKYSS